MKIFKNIVLTGIITLLVNHGVDAQPSVDERIHAARLHVQKLKSEIKRNDDGTSPGMEDYSAHAKEFECFAIGTVLGYHREVAHLDIQYASNYRENIRDKSSLSLKVLEATVSRFLEELLWAKTNKSDTALFTWNINCVGLLGIPNNLGIVTKSDPFYSITADGTRLTIHGAIDQGYAKRLESVFSRHKKITTIELGSGGGFVAEAMEAGRLIRSKKLTTQLTSYCHSACPLVFMGGIDRIVMRPYYGLGFHQLSINGKAIPLNDPTYREIATYVSQMGVDYKYVLSQMFSASPSKMSIWNIVMNNKVNDDACKANVVTFVQSAC